MNIKERTSLAIFIAKELNAQNNNRKFGDYAINKISKILVKKLSHSDLSEICLEIIK